MTIRLLSAAEARREWTGDMLVVREDRDLLHDFKLFGMRCGAAFLLTYPLWRPDVSPFRDIPYLLLFLLAGWLLYASWRLGRELKAARHPEGWLMAASRERVWLHLRSYLHAGWPRVHKTVLCLDRADIDVIYPVKVQRQAAMQLAIRLEQPLPPALIEALMNENTRMERGRFGYGRQNHEPVRLEENGQTLRVMFGMQIPPLGPALDKLRLFYPVDPPHAVPEPEAYLLPSEMPLSDTIIAEVAGLLQEGKRLEAIRYLRARTGLGLRDCKSIVDDLS